MTRPLHTALVLLACVLSAFPAAAQPDDSASPEPTNPTTLRVVTRESPPFVTRTPEGDWSGLAIDLWRTAESELGVTTEFVETDSLLDMLTAVEQNQADLALGGITITADRERSLDFTHPFLSGGLAIAVPAESGPAWLSAIRQLVSPEFFAAIGTLFALLLVIGVIVWLFERRKNADQFGGGILKGLGSGFWWSAVTMTTVGYGDKAPTTFLGRCVGLIWMFASIIIISSVTAAIASALTVSSLVGPIETADDLPGAKVATVEGSTSDAYLRAVGARRVYADSPAALLDLVASGDADAAVYDGPILRYLIAESGINAIVLPEAIDSSRYAFALPQGSPRREAINRAILDVVDSAEWQDTVRRYLGR